MHKFSYFIEDEKRCDCLVVGTNLLWGVPKRPSLAFLFFSNWSYPDQTKTKKWTMAIVDEMWTNQLANLRTGQTSIFQHIFAPKCTKIREWRTKKKVVHKRINPYRPLQSSKIITIHIIQTYLYNIASILYNVLEIKITKNIKQFQIIIPS